MPDYPKPIKRLMNQYLGKAYELELARELAKLEQSFVEWRSGHIDSGELSDRLHRFEVGPSRELCKWNNYGQKDLQFQHLAEHLRSFAISTSSWQPS